VPTLAHLTAALETWFDPRWAESWDAVGLVCGDPGETVTRVLLAVDAVPATVDEAIGWGAGLLLTHHPLLLTAVHGVPADDPKGGLVHRMIRSSVAHFVAHTNADVADPGVSDALAERLGLLGLAPLDAMTAEAVDKLVVFVPGEAADRLIDALASAGAGRIGNYDRCAWRTEGVGTFRPRAGASPTIGEVGRVESVPESRVELVVPRGRRSAVIAALRAAHPYEEPAFDLVPLAGAPSARGTGRIGALPRSMSLTEFTEHAARSLPATAWGVRAAGDPDRVVRTVAVCGGSGGGYADLARRAGVDAFLTADLKHHGVLEAVTERGAQAMAMVDAAHWATEAPWLDAVAARLDAEFGTSVEVRVSRVVTDPWTVHTLAPTEVSPDRP
jgi:dinuclear metal center YbgI/SA1388 family protein